MVHREVFHVLTDRHGGSNLSFQIACATASEHYARTVACHSDAEVTSATTGDPGEACVSEDVCSTGLRVYAGAQVLAAFVVPFGDALLHLSTATSARVGSAHGASPLHTAVELGCGCGLSGMTLSATVQRADEEASALNTLRVVFTDASTDCLALVREGGVLNAMEVVDGTRTSSAHRSDSVREAGTPAPNAARVTYPLSWGREGVATFAHDVLLDSAEPQTVSRRASVQLVLGSDLLYYRVDIVQLLDTCKRLLLLCADGPEDGSDAADTDRTEPDRVFKVAVLSHFMRIADGERKVAEAARAMGLGVVSVPLTCFLDESVVLQSGFQGLELILLFPRTQLREHSSRCRSGGTHAAGKEGEVDDDVRNRQREHARAMEDVTYFQAQMDAIISDIAAAPDSARMRGWCASLAALKAHVDVYGLSASTATTMMGAMEEESALLRILCDL